LLKVGRRVFREWKRDRGRSIKRTPGALPGA
jgi:hypothetical protein